LHVCRFAIPEPHWSVGAVVEPSHRGAAARSRFRAVAHALRRDAPHRKGSVVASKVASAG
jgi:hypothetical protein